MSLYKNYSEEIVYKILLEVLQNYPNVCKCDKCIADMMACALNHVKPKYVVNDQGKIYISALYEINKQEKISITAIVIYAVEKISANPMH